MVPVGPSYEGCRSIVRTDQTGEGILRVPGLNIACSKLQLDFILLKLRPIIASRNAAAGQKPEITENCSGLPRRCTDFSRMGAMLPVPGTDKFLKFKWKCKHELGKL
jgi:hypothetical protein